MGSPVCHRQEHTPREPSLSCRLVESRYTRIPVSAGWVYGIEPLLDDPDGRLEVSLCDIADQGHRVVGFSTEEAPWHLVCSWMGFIPWRGTACASLIARRLPGLVEWRAFLFSVQGLLGHAAWLRASLRCPALNCPSLIHPLVESHERIRETGCGGWRGYGRPLPLLDPCLSSCLGIMGSRPWRDDAREFASPPSLCFFNLIRSHLNCVKSGAER
ncbi:hypothetical protein L209DRAFT_758880 [Thermothelomyces heterothallicus CBS 203.75]